MAQNKIPAACGRGNAACLRLNQHLPACAVAELNPGRGAVVADRAGSGSGAIRNAGA